MGTPAWLWMMAFLPYVFVRARVCERVASQWRACLVNVVCNSILDALGYNNCQAWKHLTGLWARIEGQMRCGALQLCVCVCE